MSQLLQEWSIENQPGDDMKWKVGFWDQISFVREPLAACLARQNSTQLLGEPFGAIGAGKHEDGSWSCWRYEGIRDTKLGEHDDILAAAAALREAEQKERGQ